MGGSWWSRRRRGVTRLISGQSLQWRLALLTGLSVALSVILVGSTTFTVTRWSLTDQLDRELTSVAQTASAAVAISRELPVYTTSPDDFAEIDDLDVHVVRRA